VNRYYSYVNTARQILGAYPGEEPFSSFLKKFFSTNKKYGSRDRKSIGHLCYCYFRTTHALHDLPVDEKIPAALFLCSSAKDDILATLKPEWNDITSLVPGKKADVLGIDAFPGKLFPWQDELSEGIDMEKFSLSHLVQPDLFIRVRPGFEKEVVQKLQPAGIVFEMISDHCLALPNMSKLDAVLELDKEAVVQDRSSQRVGELMQSAIDNRQLPIRAWDSCAGSGGKSIMLYDLKPDVDLTATDIRDSILINLRKRFKNAGINTYHLGNLSDPSAINASDLFDIILCDAPCTGSGTWGRTPEQLAYFKYEKIDAYAALQKKIVSGTISHLKPGGYLLYITCSVFEKENMEIVDFIKQQFHLQAVKMELLKGYEQKADTMFVALLQKPL
jgi:16S rRNA (cytosine967-C5)-methyltransferase